MSTFSTAAAKDYCVVPPYMPPDMRRENVALNAFWSELKMNFVDCKFEIFVSKIFFFLQLSQGCGVCCLEVVPNLSLETLGGLVPLLEVIGGKRWE